MKLVGESRYFVVRKKLCWTLMMHCSDRWFVFLWSNRFSSELTPYLFNHEKDSPNICATLICIILFCWLKFVSVDVELLLKKSPDWTMSSSKLTCTFTHRKGRCLFRCDYRRQVLIMYLYYGFLHFFFFVITCDYFFFFIYLFHLQVVV